MSDEMIPETSAAYEDMSCPDARMVQVGEDVWYSFTDRDGELCTRPAKIVKVWSERGMGTANLCVFIDASNDLGHRSEPVLWATSACYSREPKPNTWHR